MPKKEKLSSGDWLIDWHFQRFVHIVKHDGWRIRMRRRLKNPDVPPDQREVLRGLTNFHEAVNFQKKVIYLNPALRIHPTKDALGFTLVHELAHILYRSAEGRIIRHRNIYQFEKLWNRFSDRQKDVLLGFIQKKYVPKK